jgi:hypothetical protein
MKRTLLFVIAALALALAGTGTAAWRLTATGEGAASIAAGEGVMPTTECSTDENGTSKPGPGDCCLDARPATNPSN